MVKVSSFTATLSPLGDSGVNGELRLFTPDSGPMEGLVCFVGSASGLEPGLDSVHLPGGTGTDCSAGNGCGVHVHSGTGPDACTNSTTQGGHWWNDSVFPEDPWKTVGYFGTNADGTASYADCVATGFTESLESRAFIIHANDGSRVACGLIEPDENPTFETLTSSTTELAESGVDGEITVMSGIFADVPSGVCFMGSATGLEADISSIHGGSGMDCNATNGCGVHIHSGTGCADNDAQGGHYYDSEASPVDPWLIVGYIETDGEGAASFADCVITGAVDYEGKPFIVHADDGSRLSCGILTADDVDASGVGSPIGTFFASVLIFTQLVFTLFQ